MSNGNTELEGGISAIEKSVDGNTSNNGGKPDIASSDTTDSRPRFSFVDPGTLGSEGSSGNGNGSIAGEPERKRRGRKPGSGGKSKATQTLSITGLTAIIVNTHAMLAAFTKSAELLVDEDEAAKLAEATVNVSRHYNVAMAAKTVDWINFATVAGMIYGTRLVAIRNRRAGERRATPQTANVKAPQEPIDPYAGLREVELTGYQG